MGTAQTEVDEREIKGGNQTSTKSSIITIHAPSKKKENVETYQMTQRNKYFHHWSQPHASLEDKRVVEACYSFFIF